MLNLIPKVKNIEIKNGNFNHKSLYFDKNKYSEKLCVALEKLPYDITGAKLEINLIDSGSEEYELIIDNNLILINAKSEAAAFYAIQTVRQIFKHEIIPNLYIKDYPDFEYRGFYHDVTRGKIPTVETIKKLIDDMAYYKLNSLQLYVEHTYKFKECEDIIEKTGYLSSEELNEINEYCKLNFIEFIPSLSTFGHLFELLQQDKYKHLRVLKDYKDVPNFWRERMFHHTIDPLNPQSIEVVKSLIDQYSPNFDSDIFNICCDETFDLKTYEQQGLDVGKMYVDFVKLIIDHLKNNNKKVMMWADILLQHPETIDILPDDTYFLNWNYEPNPPEENIEKFAKLNRKQIVCPATISWKRFCECIDTASQNIINMAEYGYKHGALGVLNTNWGDWGNPCSLELSMYGLVLGAEKSWSATTKIDDTYNASVNFHLYNSVNGVDYITNLSRLQEKVIWENFGDYYFNHTISNESPTSNIIRLDIETLQNEYLSLSEKILLDQNLNNNFKEEMLVALEGLVVMGELVEKFKGNNINRITDTTAWLNKYSKLWLNKNKPNELSSIVDMFTYLENI